MVTKDNKELSKSNSLIKTGPVEVQICPECGSTRIIHNQECAEIACMDCGWIVQQKIVDPETEQTPIDREQRSKYVKAEGPLTYTIYDKGLSTVIDWHDRDIYNKNISAGQKSQVYRLRKWQRRVRVSDSAEHNLALALSEITKTANKLELPRNVLEPAILIYRKIVKGRLIRGHSTQSIATATLYLACRQQRLPQTLNEIAQASKVSKKEIGKIYRCLIKEADYSTLPLHPSQHKTNSFNQFSIQEKTEQDT